MKLYTKSGDKGRTSLIGGERVCKTDLRVEAYGTVDELTAFMALLGDCIAADSRVAELAQDIWRINSTLMSVEALLACGKGGEDKVAPLAPETVAWIEQRIDALQAAVTPVANFTIPGGCATVSQCHVCRTVCRRAERAALRAAESYTVDTVSLIYLNRLSDYLYALGRMLNCRLGVEEILWRP